MSNALELYAQAVQNGNQILHELNIEIKQMKFLTKYQLGMKKFYEI